jgi:hypothetical protein
MQRSDHAVYVSIEGSPIFSPHFRERWVPKNPPLDMRNDKEGRADDLYLVTIGHAGDRKTGARERAHDPVLPVDGVSRG